MNRARKFFRNHKRFVLSIGFLVLFATAVSYATPPTSPYNPGDTLDPQCAPGDVNCYVVGSGGSSTIYTDGSLTGSGTAGDPLSVVGLTDSSDPTDNPVLSVTVATGGVLPGSPTYNNGSSGIGATLTENGNGALGTINNAATATNMRVLVKNQANQIQNGIYVITQEGSAGTPYILTRSTDSDESDELDGQIVSASTGTLKGRLFAERTAEPVVGTDNVVYAQTTSIFTTQAGSGTQVKGQIPFWTTNARQLNRGSSNFVWDNVNNRLGIGTATPGAPLSIQIATLSNSPQFLVTDNTGAELFHITSDNNSNFFAGYKAGAANVATSSTSGEANTFVGSQAGFSNISGHWDTATGYQALYSNTTGSWNVANGYQSLYSNISGTSNVASGFWSLKGNTTGIDNMAYGTDALQSNISGNYNDAVGFQSLYSNTAGTYNDAFGFRALYTNTGNYDTAFGAGSLQLATGDSNAAYGYASMSYATTGTGNSAFGPTAGNRITTGSYNTAVGNAALYNGGVGNYNTVIGAFSDVPNASLSGQLNIGNVLYGTGLLQGGSLSTDVTATPTVSGAIGIGTATPAATLDVNGSLKTAGTNTLTNLAGHGTRIVQVDNNGVLSVTTIDPATVSSGGGSSQWDDVGGGINYAGGNVGIGNTTPSQSLDVNGGIQGQNLTITGTAVDGPAAPTNFQGTINYSPTTSGYYNAYNIDTNYHVYSYKNVGGFRVYSTTYATLNSDLVDDNSHNPYEIDLSWDPVVGADGYRIIYSDFGSYDAGVDTTNTSYMDGGSAGFSYNTSAVVVTPSVIYTNVNNINGGLNVQANAASASTEVDDPQNLQATIEYDPTNTLNYGYVADGSNYDIDYEVYAYKIIDGGRVYSSGDAELDTDLQDDGLGDPYAVSLNWDAVPGADGYRVIFSHNDQYDESYDTDTNSLFDDGCGDNVCTSNDVNVYPSSGYSINTNANVISGGLNVSGDLKVTNGGAIVATGNDVDNTPGPIFAEGSTFAWIPGFAAFRAGYVDNSSWNPGNVGAYSAAFGYDTKASGQYSTAIGGYTTANGSYSFAGGSDSQASGDYSAAFGDENVALGYASTAFGSENTASGDYSTAFGNNTTADSVNSFVIGSYNNGGGNSESWNPNDPLFEIGNGTDSNDLSDAFEVFKDGSASFQNGNMTLDSSGNLYVSGDITCGGSCGGGGGGAGLWNDDGDTTISYSAGNVGIGTTTPASALDVAGKVTATGLKVNGDTSVNIGGQPDNVTASIVYDPSNTQGYAYVADGSHTDINYKVYAYTANGGLTSYGVEGQIHSGFSDNGSGENFAVDVSWDPVVGADGYRIILSDNGAWDQSYDTTDTSFVDDGNESLSSDVTVLPEALFGFNSNLIGGLNTDFLQTENIFNLGDTFLQGKIRGLGTYGVGNSYSTFASQTVMAWNPTNGTFRAGGVDGSGVWDSTQVGDYSTALGYSTGASSYDSFAIGRYNADATGTDPNNWVDTDPLFEVGNGTDSNDLSDALLILKNGNTTIGGNLTITGTVSALGGTASGASSVALGYLSNASGQYATAFGAGNLASGDNSTVFGISNIASGQSSAAFGQASVASGTASTAFGNFTSAFGDYSVAFGNGTTASSVNQFVFGQNNTDGGTDAVSWIGTDPLFEIGNGVDNTHLHDAVKVLKNGNTVINGDLTVNGNVYCTGGTCDAGSGGTGGTTVFETDGNANGSQVLYNLVAGTGITLTDDGSGNITIDSAGGGGGGASYDGTGTPSFQAIGGTASGNYSTAFGDTTASGDYSSAFGNAIASGDYSGAFGEATASGVGSFAEGQYQTVASGDYSSAFGLRSFATGDFSNAFGSNDTASGANSTTFGGFTNATSAYQFTLGAYNVDDGTNPTSWVDTDPLFVVGNGNGITDDPAEFSDAFEVLKNGDTKVGGNLVITGNIRTGTSSTSGLGDVALGYLTTASGSSTAFGVQTTATGTYSTAFGYIGHATGYVSTVFGIGNTASGDYASAAFGDGTIASNAYATTFGLDTRASGQSSTAFGDTTTASTLASFAIGRYNVDGGTGAATWVSTDPLFEIGNGSVGNLADALTVLKNGDIGISQAAPTHLLDVGTSAITTGTTVATFTNGGGTCNIVPSTTGGVLCSSDMNLKKNITNLVDNSPWNFNTNINPTNQSVLADVLALNPVDYNWNAEQDTDAKHAGFIAQEVQQVFPDLVATDPDTGLLSLNYAGFMPYTVEAIKEMNVNITNIDDLTKTNTWRDALLAWFADSANGITNFFSKTVTTNQLCVKDDSGETCLTRTQVNNLLNGQQSSGGGSSAPQGNNGGDDDNTPPPANTQSDDVTPPVVDTGDTTQTPADPASVITPDPTPAPDTSSDDTTPASDDNSSASSATSDAATANQSN